jgi:glycosyltransferase involved in cell wall biosynthesis
MANPLVSVIIPAYNAAHFLPSAIESVRWQEYEPIEILIVDDGSTDNTEEVVGGLGDNIRYFRQENSGPSAARNRAISEARGEFIGFLDADDQWPRQKLSLQLGRFYAEPDLEVVLGRIQFIALPGRELPKIEFEGPDNSLTHVHLGSGLYRRSAIDRVGPFNESLRFCEDVDWFLRAREAGLPMRILQPITLLYRLHSDNMTMDRESSFRGTAVVLKHSLDRRRKQDGTAKPLPRWFSYDEWWPGTPPLVSVIVPAYNAERFVGHAIRSILAQDYSPIEILVVDDGSTDHTAAAVQEFGPRVRFLRQANAGAGAARNRGIEHATGRYIAFLDADDLWEPGKLSRQMELLEADPSCSFLFGQVQQYRDGAGNVGDPAGGCLPGTMLARREAVDAIGPLRTDLKVGEFVDWIARARDAGFETRVEPNVWLRRRIHGDNLVTREHSSQSDYLRVIKAAMDRRRAAARPPRGES